MAKHTYTVHKLLNSAKRGHQIIKEWDVPLEPEDENITNLAALIDAYSLAPDKLRSKMLLKMMRSAYYLGKSAGTAEFAAKF